MQLALQWRSLLISLSLGVSCLSLAQTLPPANAVACKLSVNNRDFESRTDGPFVQDVGYSRSLHACVVIRVQGFPAPYRKVDEFTEIVSVSGPQRVWRNERLVPQGSRPEPPYPALTQEIKKLDIELAPR